MTAFTDLAPRWPEISALLDQALDLPAAQRAAWLDRLGVEHAPLEDELRGLLGPHGGVETGEFLNTLPRLQIESGQTADALEPACGMLVGPYRLLRELGQGGMGSVWLAERSDGQLKRQVALKLPHRSWAGGLAERMARERDILATLEHPNIARLYDAGIDRHGRPYLAMEYADGQPIDVHCRERSLTLRARIGLLLQVCDAVAHAHARLVVHRDLKPSNILVTAEGQVRLLDFGIAKLMEGNRAEETALTQLSGRALTLDYASPEQIRGEPLSTTSDVYSLAVVAFELLAGSRPYRLKRGSAAELEEAIANADLPRASDAAVDPALRKQLRGDMDAIFNKALKKDSARRYGSVEAFAQDLQRHLNREPVTAQPERFGYRTGKFVSRYWLQVTAAGVASLALMAGAGVALWQAREARLQALRAQTEATTAQAVQGFIEAVFSANSSDQQDAQKARDTTARQLLDLGAQRIDNELRNAPEARLRLLGIMATMYSDMGLYEKATELQRQRATLARQTWGVASAATAQTLADHARELTNMEQIEPATQLLSEATSILDALGDNDSAARFSVLATLAATARRTNAEQANNAATRAVAIARRNQTSAQLVRAIHLEALSAIDLGRYGAARDSLTEVIRLVEGDPALGRSRLVDLYSDLGDAQIQLGDLDAALANRRRALELAQNTPGTSTLAIHSAAWSLAGLLATRGYLREGIALMRPAYEWARAGQSEIGMVAAMLTMTYGRYLVAYGHTDEGLAVLDEVTTVLKGQAADASTSGVGSLARASAMTDQGRYGEAERAAEQAREVFSAANNFEEWTLHATRVKRRVLAAAGKADAAWADFQAEQARLKGRSVPRAEEPLFVLLESAQLQLAVGDLEAARRAAEEVLGDIEPRPTRHFLRLPEADANRALGSALLRQGRAVDALPKLKRAVELYRVVYDPQRSLTLASALLELAKCQRSVGDGAAVAPLIAETLRIHSSHRAVGQHHRATLQ
jgi:eukaryotic-like serine/threonine-protein kinase